MISIFGRLAAPAVALELMGWIFYVTGRINADEFVVLLQVTFWYGVMAFGTACIRKALHGNRKDEPRRRPHLSAVPLGDRAGRLEGGGRPVVSAAGTDLLAHPGGPRHNVLASRVTGSEGPGRPADSSPIGPLGAQRPRPGAAHGRAHLRDVSRGR